MTTEQAVQEYTSKFNSLAVPILVSHLKKVGLPNLKICENEVRELGAIRREIDIEFEQEYFHTKEGQLAFAVHMKRIRDNIILGCKSTMNTAPKSKGLILSQFQYAWHIEEDGFSVCIGKYIYYESKIY